MDSREVSSPRERIIAAALELLGEGGEEAVSTRAVSAAAGVQPPTIYRFFGDKQGLLDAVAANGLHAYLATKSAVPLSDDPVADLRRGWDLHVELGLARPALYTLMYGRPRAGAAASPAARAAADILADHIRRIAEAGRLRVPEALAAGLVHAAGSGTTLALIATPEDQRDPALSPTAREAVIAAITTDQPIGRQPGPVTAAVALHAALPHVDTLTAGEKTLLAEWLDRITT
ncbi:MULTISPECIES: TetR/AcrR family transcriptional regulator [unclassified Nonomuraea]|uniref:TetR/AcrR family transcriptional regulator n=1 Tax=unclassified Nonomuraea TaxID=2593643 RepID=UPI0033D58C2E